MEDANVVDVDAVVNDDVDGPKPMREMKSVEKTDNAADQFSNAHQSAYEAREKPSRDIMQTVENHNMTHPRLKDELEKRQSVTKVTAIKRNASTYIRKCSDCEKWHKRLMTENMKHKRKYSNNLKKREMSNIKKRKANFANRNKRLQKRRFKYGKKSLMGVCSQCLYVDVLDKKIGTDNRPMFSSLNLERSNNYEEEIFKAQEFDKRRSDIDSTSKLKIENIKETKEGTISIVTSGYPETSFHSFSSYHSYRSMNNDEPKV